MEKDKQNIDEKYNLEFLERQVNNLTKLVNINGIINSTLDIKKLLKIIMEIIKDIMDTDASTLLLYDEQSNDLVFKVALGEAENTLTEKYRVKVGQGIAGWVAENRKPTYVNDVYSDRRFDPTYDRDTGFVTRAILCSPLLFKGKLLGVIQAVNPNNRPEFDDEDMKLFSFFSDQCGLAVQNAIFFQSALEEERIKAEIISAQSMQESLIPQIDKRFDNFHIAARSVPAREVGGDFHGLYQFDETHLGISLGDIHEKGIAGGIRAAIISGALMTLTATRGKNPSSLIKHLYEAVGSDLSYIKDVSLFYGVIDSAKKKLQFVNAGIAYPILIRDKVARYLRFGKRSIQGGEDFKRRVNVQLQAGDFFVIITDGITSLRNKNGQQLGLKRIMEQLEQEFDKPTDITDSLINYANEFSGEKGRREDISVFVVKVL